MERHTKYEELTSKFFNKIQDYEIADMDESIAYDIALSYIAPACNMFQSCQQPLEDRDDETQEFLFELTPSNKEILVNYMVIEYIDSNYLRKRDILESRLTSTDFRSLNQYNMIDKVTALRQALKEENDQIAINKSYLDSPIFAMTEARRWHRRGRLL